MLVCCPFLCVPPCVCPRRCCCSGPSAPHVLALPCHPADERLLALDAGNKKQVAPRGAVSQLETVRVPQPGAASRAGAAPSAGCASRGGSPSPELETCAICLEDARPGDRFRVLPCRHAFHCRCIDRWLTAERNSCPVCTRPAV